MLAVWIVVGLSYCSCLITSCQDTFSELGKKTEAAVEAAEESVEKSLEDRIHKERDILSHHLHEKHVPSHDVEEGQDSNVKTIHPEFAKKADPIKDMSTVQST